MSAAPTSSAAVRVLVVEDNADDRELLLRQLRTAGISDHVKFISDGKEALLFLTEREPESNRLIALFLDLNLPSLNGLDLLRALRQEDRFQSTSVIVMTSSNDPRDLEECRRLKVSNYVSKPVTFDVFSKAVADVFHQPKTNSNSSAEL